MTPTSPSTGRSADPASGLVVLGGGPAGLSAARSFREHGGTGPVRIVSADQHPPYDRPPLSKDFLRGESEVDALPLEEEAFYAEHDVELVLRRRAVDLDPAHRTLRLDDGSELAYGTCVLALGSVPAVLPVPGADHPDLFVLRSRTHGERLRAAAVPGDRAVVVGSGFIGCEAAASLAARGLEVTVVSTEPVPQEARLGERAGRRIADWLRGSGVRLVGGVSVTALREGRTVELDDGTTWTGDLVVVAAGAVPQGDLAARAGLAGAEGRVHVDERMRTSAEGVLAAGDVALAVNAVAGRRVPVEHWGEALRMGEIAGATAAGADDTWAQVPGFWSEIGEHTLKYAAWGDGWDDVRFVDHGEGAFTAWYGQEGTLVGVLTHEADGDYERGEGLVERGAALDTVG